MLSSTSQFDEYDWLERTFLKDAIVVLFGCVDVILLSQVARLFRPRSGRPARPFGGKRRGCWVCEVGGKNWRCGFQESRNLGIQKFRNSGIQEFSRAAERTPTIEQKLGPYYHQNQLGSETAI